MMREAAGFRGPIIARLGVRRLRLSPSHRRQSPLWHPLDRGMLAPEKQRDFARPSTIGSEKGLIPQPPCAILT